MFKEFFKQLLLESEIKVQFWDENAEEYDPWEVYDHVDQIFKKVGINTKSDSQLSVFITYDEKVIAGAFTIYSLETVPSDDDEPEEYIEYSFDIAVDPEFQKAGIGYVLIKSCIEFGEQYKDIAPVLCRNWVVNPLAARLLETHFGFEETADHGDGHSHMERWL